MKRVIAVILTVIFITLLLPLAVVWIMGAVGNENPGEKTETGTVSVYLADEERTVDMDINQYLKCVVSAEMPADFEMEALKAQAVAARTYLYAHMENAQTNETHNGAVICTDMAHCQAYISEEERREKWRSGADEKWDKISRAVEETSGEIMTYNGEIISAVFHSTSSGNTEAAVDVWGNDVPYLQSVASVGDTESPKYHSELTVSEAEFKNTVSEKVSGTDWSKGLVSDISRSQSGGIISLNVGGVNMKGSEFRNIFSLRSANIEIVQDSGNVKMIVKGYGHGVGMSQYGANYMASQGSGYEEILKTYYQGVEIVTK